MKKIKAIITVSLFSVLLFSMSALCYFGTPEEYTDSERRPLAQMPEFSANTVSNGEFMLDFEKYSADQFPFREGFRTIKAIFSKYCLNKKENNGIFTSMGHVSKLDGEINQSMLDYSVKLFRSIYEKNIKNTNSNVYLSIVPDKNCYIGKGFPCINYAELEKYMESETSDFMTYIPIIHALSADDYYKTDSHWKQENITDIAEILANEMGTDVKTEYTVKTLDKPFFGVYAGQSALPLKPDTIKYLTNSAIENCTVTYYNTGKPEKGEIYDMEKAYGKDPYEMFLSGVTPLVVIENPTAKNSKELVIFRDSFGSSLAPLMTGGYSKVTVVDLRYIQSAFLGNLVEFNNCDVLFLYSTSILNNSLSMK